MTTEQPTREQAEAAVKTLLHYIAGDQGSKGLVATPSRVIDSYSEIFSGYNKDVRSILDKKFDEIADYNEVILLKSIDFSSTCEHHMLPFSGVVDVAYIPRSEVLGISKLARLVDIFAKRLQLQERMTSEIACSLQDCLNPKGVAVRVLASHSCMINRGVKKNNTYMESVHFTGDYKNCNQKRQEFLLSTR